jgi:hypothetical protein
MMRRAISHVILSKGETTMRGFAKPSHGGFANLYDTKQVNQTSSTKKEEMRSPLIAPRAK